jgi:hypothetical protein
MAEISRFLRSELSGSEISAFSKPNEINGLAKS